MQDVTLIIPVPCAALDIASAPRVTLRLHARYLSAKSLLLRGLLSGISPLDLVRDLSTSRHHPSIPLRIPPSRLPQLLPSPSDPALFLPVPDPRSILPLVHWMYSDNTDLIESALDQGLIQWEGLVRNVEYLCLPTDIKVFLGRWYRNKLLPAQPSLSCTPRPADEDDRSDIDSDCDDPGRDDYSNPSTDDKMQCDDACRRGRTRDVKPLAQLCGQLPLCTT